jgi:hypothetical protein
VEVRLAGGSIGRLTSSSFSQPNRGYQFGIARSLSVRIGNNPRVAGGTRSRPECRPSEASVNSESRGNSFRAPGFPLFLSAIYRISYGSYPLAYLSLCFIGALTSVITYLAARYVLSEDRARVTGAIVAFYFPHIYFSTLFLSECLFAFVISLVLLFLLMHFETSSLGTIAIAGALVGYATLTRPVALLLLPQVVALLLCRHSRHLRCALMPSAALIVAWSCVMLPWVLRNHHVHKQWVLLTTNGGSTFYGANTSSTAFRARLGSAESPSVTSMRKH